MSDQQHEKLPKLLENRRIAEMEVKSKHQQIAEAVDNGDRRVRVERLVKSCIDA